MQDEIKDSQNSDSRSAQAGQAARLLAETKAILSTLLDNFPGLVFAKDAQSGVYLSCNRAFAEYAHKSPEQVLGLTDAEIFDPQTAAHFSDDDRKTLAMDEPYVFFEDVPDAVGNPRQFETKKFKFIDGTGRILLMGLCRDVTEVVRLRKETEQTRATIERVRESNVIFTRIAQTLARGYSDLYYVNLETGSYIEYRTREGTNALAEDRRGTDFFAECKPAINKLVHPDDRASLIKAMDKQTLLAALDHAPAFVVSYRLLMQKGWTYVSMKVSRMQDDERFIIIGIMDVDEQVRQRLAVEQAREERIAYARLNALSQDFLCLFSVDPETGRYRLYSSSESFEQYKLPTQGEDFFAAAREQGSKLVYRDDLERFLSGFGREQVLEAIASHGRYALSYRLMVANRPNYIQLKAAMVNERGSRHLVVGILDIDSSVRQEQKFSRRLALAQAKATFDALTGVRNNHAYRDLEEELNAAIAGNRHPRFALTILDVNDLKRINDSEGHQAGDRYLCAACKIICDTFLHSAVFRFGGDEFVVVSQGEDFERIDELLEKMRAHNEKAILTGGISIACGMSKYDGDARVTSVFERADFRMYKNKKDLKARTVR